MKIDSGAKNITTGPAADGLARPARLPEPPPPPARGDSVSLSDLSSQLAGTEGASKASTFDAAKVDAIKAAIAEGRFKVNVDAIADGLIESTRELLQATRK